MKTTSILMQTLCVPCLCHCRYCLLSWDRHLTGAPYERSATYARRFADWLQANRPEISFNFAFGYSMEHPRLFEALDFLRSIGSVSARLLQLDGVKIRTETECAEWMCSLRAHGVEQVNLTFYGLREAHDRFAERPGEFDNLLRLAAAAQNAGIGVSAGIPLTAQSAPETDALLDLLAHWGLTDCRLFVPHEEGRGVCLNDVRFSLRDEQLLSDRAKSRFNRTLYRPEREWLTGRFFRPAENRLLLISLTPENIVEYESMPPEAVIEAVERLDDAFYAAIPPLEAFCARYGDPQGDRFFGQRDLYQHYQKRFLQETGLSLYDVTDERFTGSRRY